MATGNRDVREIIESLPIDRLRPTPNGYQGCCCINPNHIDNKPSMHINLQKGMVKCFSCGAFKPLFSFLLDNGATFDEAIDYLFVDYTKEAKDTQELTEYMLGRKIPKSMVDRGFTIDTLKHFEVGYDEVLGHTTIPLRYNGKLYGIQYRRYPKDFWATDGFDKDNFIYNFQPTLQRVYVEGFTDTWRTWQNGTENVSACLNAWPSDGQLQIMDAHDELLLALDNDKAGWRGAFRIHHIFGREKEVKVIMYPGKDPGDCPTDRWLYAVNNPRNFVELELQLIKRFPNVYDQIVKEVRK